MKNPFHPLIRTTLLMFLCLLLFCNAMTAFAAPVRVAILPFDMHAEKDLTFLRDGIVDMLGSRLAWQDKVDVISTSETAAALSSVKGFEGQSRALLVGGKLHADYVLFGSLTVFGESVSIDAKMVDVGGKQEPLPFFAQTSSMGAVIPQINQFATNINTTVFGRTVARPAATLPATTAPVPQAKPAPQAYDPRMHPDKLLQSGIQAENQAPDGAAGQLYQAPNPAFVTTAAPGAGTGGPTFWKSRNLKLLISGLAIADVNHDGEMEVVVVATKSVSIYQIKNNRMVKVADAAQTRTSTFLSVDVADVNGNGIPEIYVTSLGPNDNNIDSFVLEYASGTYKTLLDHENWYFRTAMTIDRGVILLGQRQQMADSSIFIGSINEMQWQGNQLVPGRQVLIGGKANLMGLAYGDITHSGSSVVAAYSDWDRIRIYSAGGEMIWEDPDRSGGNTLDFSPAKTNPDYKDRQFYPLRIRLTDIDRDGKIEVLFVRHEELAKNMLQNFRLFRKTQLELASWNGLGLASKWRTQTLSGRTSDFAVGDFDNDGTDELLIALVSKEGSVIFTDAVSSLIAFDLNPTE